MAARAALLAALLPTTGCVGLDTRTGTGTPTPGRTTPGVGDDGRSLVRTGGVIVDRLAGGDG